MWYSREAVGIIFSKQWFTAFDPHPCCPSSSTSLTPLLVLKGGGGAEGPGNRKDVRRIAGHSAQVPLGQPFQALSEARR